jgi:AP-2 complex subunit alpha
MDLPITIAKFVDGLEVEGQKFFGMWAQIKEAPAAYQEVFPAAQVINMPMVQKLVSQGFNFQVLAGLDPNPNNLVAAGTFTCASLGQVICMVRLEANIQANMFRYVTINMTHRLPGLNI